MKTEREVGSGDQVFNRAGDEHLAGVGEGRDTDGDINGQAAEVTGGRVALPGVDTRCEVQSEGAIAVRSASAQAIARLGDRNAASQPSAVVQTCRPRNRVSSRCTTVRWPSRTF